MIPLASLSAFRDEMEKISNDPNPLTTSQPKPTNTIAPQPGQLPKQAKLPATPYAGKGLGGPSAPYKGNDKWLKGFLQSNPVQKPANLTTASQASPQMKPPKLQPPKSGGMWGDFSKTLNTAKTQALQGTARPAPQLTPEQRGLTRLVPTRNYSGNENVQNSWASHRADKALTRQSGARPSEQKLLNFQ
tara:strand:- start:721 stop:1287 length:567 start_codon:yes stop_codon:yes gene_type:complete